MWPPRKPRRFPTEGRAFSRTRPDSPANRTRARPRNTTARFDRRRKWRQGRQNNEEESAAMATGRRLQTRPVHRLRHCSTPFSSASLVIRMILPPLPRILETWGHWWVPRERGNRCKLAEGLVSRRMGFIRRPLAQSDQRLVWDRAETAPRRSDQGPPPKNVFDAMYHFSK